MQRMRFDFHAVVRRPAARALVVVGACLAAAAPARATGLGATVSMLGEREDASERYVSEPPESDTLLPASPLEMWSRVALRLDGSLGAGLSAEAVAALWLNVVTSNTSAFSDDGSYVRLRWQPSGWADRQGLTLTVFPFDSSRLHLGNEHPAIWGSRTPFGSNARGDIPGLEARLEREGWYARAFAKTGLGTNAASWGSERLFQVGTGGGVEVLPVLRLELEGGGVDQGPIFDSPRAGEITGSTAAVSARALYHHGAPIGRSVDLSFYRSEPGFLDSVLVAESYPGGVSASVSLEGSWLSQTGLSADFRQKRDWSGLAAVQARLKVGYLRAHALGLVRSLWFGDSANVDAAYFWDLGTNKLPERLVSLGVDYHFPALRLTPGLVLRADMPASFDYALDFGGNNPAASFFGSRKVVMAGPTAAAATILPSGASPGVVVTTKATLQWAFDDRLCAVGEAWWKRDPNRTVFRDDAAGVAQPVFAEDDELGLAFLLQAGF